MSAPRSMKSGKQSCPKCGGTDIWTSYHRSRWASSNGCSYGSFATVDGEHLHYGCRTCGYDWTGPTLTQKAAA